MDIDKSKIKFKELSEHVELLNETGLLEKPVPLVGVTKDAIVKLFIAAVQSVPDDKEGNWTGPVKVANYYTKIIVIPDSAKKPDEEKEPEEEAEKGEPTKEKEKSKKDKPRPRTTLVGDRFGWAPGSKCDMIHQLVISAGKEGITKEEAVKLALKFGSKEPFTKNILGGATRMGWITKSDAGKYYPVAKK